jgi:hypothetical protein
MAHELACTCWPELYFTALGEPLVQPPCAVHERTNYWKLVEEYFNGR